MYQGSDIDLLRVIDHSWGVWMTMTRIRALLIGFTMLASLPCSGGVPAAYAAADGCPAGVKSDFNGDGRSDTVVSDPYATVDGLTEAGRVLIVYGDADNLVGQGARAVINQGADSVGGIAETGDRFGTAMAAGDLDCDGYTDLVVGTPKEDINGQADSGYVQIIWGAAGGLAHGDASRNLTQTNFGLTIHAGDQFGYAVDALEDVGQGGTPAPDAFALAIGAPGYDVSGHNDAGLVGFLAALDGGNVATWSPRTLPACRAQPRLVTASAPPCPSTTSPVRTRSSTPRSGCRTRTSARGSTPAA